MHYTSKAFQSMTYNAPSKVPDREEHLPSRVLPPSLFNTSKDVEVPLKDENEKPAAGRSRVEALMNKVESLSKSAGTSRASAAQRGDVSIAPGNTDMSMFASQTDTEAQIEVDEPEPTPATQEHPSTVPFEEVKASSPKQETAPSSEQSVDAEDDIMSQPLPAEHDTDEEAEFEPERPVEDPEPEINIKESRNIEIEEEDVGEESEVEDDGSVAQSEDDREEPEVQTQRPSPVSTKTTAATEVGQAFVRLNSDAKPRSRAPVSLRPQQLSVFLQNPNRVETMNAWRPNNDRVPAPHPSRRFQRSSNSPLQRVSKASNERLLHEKR